MSTITCQRCGEVWPAGELFDDLGELDTARFHFKSDPALDRPLSLKNIVDAGADMVACPKDPLPGRPAFDPARLPDSERDPGSGDADAVHRG